MINIGDLIGPVPRLPTFAKLVIAVFKLGKANAKFCLAVANLVQPLLTWFSGF